MLPQMRVVLRLIRHSLLTDFTLELLPRRQPVRLDFVFLQRPARQKQNSQIPWFSSFLTNKICFCWSKLQLKNYSYFKFGSDLSQILQWCFSFKSGFSSPVGIVSVFSSVFSLLENMLSKLFSLLISGVLFALMTSFLTLGLPIRLPTVLMVFLGSCTTVISLSLFLSLLCTSAWCTRLSFGHVKPLLHVGHLNGGSVT